MPKVVKIRTEPAICSIPLHQAVYCENCNTISNSRPYRVGFVAVKQFCGWNRYSTAILTLRAELHSPSNSPYSAQSEPKRLAFNRQLLTSTCEGASMHLYARSRPGTTPSFWRGYHNAQLKVVSSCMRSAASAIVREASIQELIADFDKRKTPAAVHFVSVASR
jgi:hypothetical protein